MPLPTGQISMSQVNTELGLPSTTTISLNQANVRALAGVPTGAISMQNLQGKSATWVRTLSTNQTDLNLYTWATGQGYPGSGSAEITIAPGVYIISSSTSNAALTIPNQFGAGNLRLINNGFVIGKGGNGGSAAPSGITHTMATAGGAAISISTPILLTNNSFVAGGGGGGASLNGAAGTGGGGGGAGGGNGGASRDAANNRSVGGAGATTPNTAGANGGALVTRSYGGAGGGLIIPGTGGAGAQFSLPTTPTRVVAIGGGAGGGGGGMSTQAGPIPTGTFANVVGGGGGGYGATGGPLGTATAPGGPRYIGGAGGSANNAGNVGNPSGAPVAGAAGGRGIQLNGNTVTTSGSGSIWGAVS